MIEREDHDSHTTLRFAHGKASALDSDFARAITAALRDAEAAAKPLLLTGTGKIFSAGVDLKRIVEADDDEIRDFLEALEECFEALFRFPLPVTAAINGHAIAGGCVIAAACDYRVMAIGKARIGVPELLVGVPFPPVAFEVTRDAFPSETHADAFYHGLLLRPEEAVEHGWIHDTCEREEVVPCAEAWLAKLTEIPERTLRLTKLAHRSPSFERIERAQSVLQDEVIRTWQDREVRAAVRRYVERALG